MKSCAAAALAASSTSPSVAPSCDEIGQSIDNAVTYRKDTVNVR